MKQMSRQCEIIYLQMYASAPARIWGQRYWVGQFLCGDERMRETCLESRHVIKYNPIAQ